MTTTKKDGVVGDILSLCSKCKSATEHTITARIGEKVSKVQCRTCGNTHRYLNPDGPRTTRKTPKLTPEEIWNQFIQSAASKKKISYTLSGTFKQNDLIDHSHFGLGVVTQLLSEDKIQVVFREGEKMLIMGLRAPVQ